jgi:hypothetical protein
VVKDLQSGKVTSVSTSPICAEKAFLK